MGIFTPVHDLNGLNLMRFTNIAIILRILLDFFQVFYPIFRDFLGFGDSGI
jgi:hypothetical protein